MIQNYDQEIIRWYGKDEPVEEEDDDTYTENDWDWH